MGKSWFVTGTDTGIGKTFVTCALLRGSAARGLRAVGMKPVAAGTEDIDGRQINEDTARLMATANFKADESLVTQYCLQAPIAPHLAARDEGVNIEMISTSTIRVSVVCSAGDMERAARALHTAFGLDSGADYSAPLPERK